MKKMMTALMLALLLPTCAAAQSAVRIDGTIEAARTQTILAPHSGMVGDFVLRAGDEMEAGDELFTLSAEMVYAEFDGTVTAVFAKAGDSAAYAADRYGALCYLERDTLYTAECSTSGASSENENKIIHAGERVYIRSKASEDRTGEAIITSVEGRKYSLEITSFDDIRINENVKVYRDSRFAGSSCIGEGKVSRVDPVGVTAEGYVRAVHVTDDQKVSRGDLLFEIIPEAMDGLKGSDGVVRMPQDGVVLSVAAESGVRLEKDAPMATYCRRQDMVLICPADEEDLAEISVGMDVKVTLDAFRDQTIDGRVEKIAAAGEGEGSSASFDVTISLQADDHVRIGMNATVEF